MINFNKQKRNKIASILIVLCSSYVCAGDYSPWVIVHRGESITPGGDWTAVLPNTSHVLPDWTPDSISEGWNSIENYDVPLLQDGKIEYGKERLCRKVRTYKIEGAPIIRYTVYDILTLETFETSIDESSATTVGQRWKPTIRGGSRLIHNNEPVTEQVDDLHTILRFSQSYQDGTNEIYVVDRAHFQDGYYIGCEKYNLSINTKIDSLGEKSQRTDKVSLITNLVMNESLIYQVLDMLRIYGRCAIEASPVILRSDIENHVECVCFTSTDANNVHLSSLPC